MAEYLAFQPHLKFSLNRNCAKELCSASQDIHIKTLRNCYSGCFKVTQLSSWKVLEPRSFGLAKLNASQYQKKSPVICYYFGSLINTDGAASGWIPVVDQVLLMTSIFLTYTAGEIPVNKSLRFSPKSILKDSPRPADPSFSGSAMDYDQEVNLKLTWDTVKDKLVDSLNAIECGVDLGNRITELEQDHAKRPSNLCALAEGPRFRLLWASFQRLKEEVKIMNPVFPIFIGEVRIIYESDVFTKTTNIQLCFNAKTTISSTKCWGGGMNPLPLPLEMEGVPSELEVIGFNSVIMCKSQSVPLRLIVTNL